MSKLDELKKHMYPGKVYRRSELAEWSTSVDRHLKQLLKDGTLVKLSGGLYYYPKKTVFGFAPADDLTLIKAYLKDDRFLLTSPNAYNTLGVGATQLYNESVVYNHKRHGRHQLGGRVFDFCMKSFLPKSLSEEFLLVDLVNNVEKLVENKGYILERVKNKARSMEKVALADAARYYGNVITRKFFAKVLSNKGLRHVA